jgi:hypothetical protein
MIELLLQKNRTKTVNNYRSALSYSSNKLQMLDEKNLLKRPSSIGIASARESSFAKARTESQRPSQILLIKMKWIVTSKRISARNHSERCRNTLCWFHLQLLRRKNGDNHETSEWSAPFSVVFFFRNHSWAITVFLWLLLRWHNQLEQSHQSHRRLQWTALDP